MSDNTKDITNTLIIIHQLYSQGDINEEQKNSLKRLAIEEFEGFF